MAQNHPKTVEQEIREPTAQPSDNKKTSPLPKRISFLLLVLGERTPALPSA